MQVRRVHKRTVTSAELCSKLQPMSELAMRATMALRCAVLALITTTAAFAEDCSMIGCRGNIGYVFLPGDGTNLDYIQNGRTCSAPDDANPFEGKNGGQRGSSTLPDVNATVGLRTYTRLLQERDIAENLEQFHAVHSDPPAGSKECHLSWSQPEMGDGIGSAVTVKILGYRTILGRERYPGKASTGTYSTQLLFALVQVIQD